MGRLTCAAFCARVPVLRLVRSVGSVEGALVVALIRCVAINLVFCRIGGLICTSLTGPIGSRPATRVCLILQYSLALPLAMSWFGPVFMCAQILLTTVSFT